MRWIVHALSTELFGESKVLAEFPKRKDLRAIGMSDPLPIAGVLARKFTYRNTCFDREPRLDITDVEGAGEYDFIVASEVFEHVRPPVQRAFDNLARLLKPEGFAVFSAPYETEGATIEHFPNLLDWRLVELRSGHVLVNRTAEGQLEVFDGLNFHGGPGMTLEMRVFSESDLLRNCDRAGFRSVTVAQDFAPFGIVWEPWARGLVLRKRV
ncbi:MAG: methyltransferase domain-containing protein [Acidobacteriota bacterium]|nr:methyltransferase domain-containing protein [Acidobacteriota bacterium]